MKHFLTICMAMAMSASAFYADARGNQGGTMMHPEEGTAAFEVCKTRARSARNDLTPPKPAPASRFHKMMNEKEARRNGNLQPSRITASGDNIFGYLGFYEGPEDLPVGYYELQEEGVGKMLWKDPYFIETGMSFTNAAKIDNRIVGYILDEIFGKLFGIYYVEIDAETGELLREEVQDLEFNSNYLSIFAFDPEDEKFYGYGRVDGTMCFLSAPAWDPFNYTFIKKLSGKEMCLSMCYNPEEKSIVGINLNYQLVKIGKDGRQKSIMDMEVRNGDKYVTGMVYSPKSKKYYWNINYTNGSSSLATIDPVEKEIDVYEKFSYIVEYYNMMTTDPYIGNPGTPMSPQAGSPVFDKGNLTGTVSFTLPLKTIGGEDLKGEVEYITYVNGQPYSTGKATIEDRTDAAGNRVPTAIDAEFSVPEPGKYSFSMRVKVNELESQKGSTFKWIGNDTPTNPTKVRLLKQKSDNPNEEIKPGSYTVSWDAVTTGINDGFVDTEKMEYVVKINGQEYTCTDTHLNVILPTERDLEAYKAEVKAVCNGYESQWIESNAVTEGKSLTLPAYITPTPDQYNVSIVLDNNEDSYSWMLKQSKDPENPYYLHSDFSHTAKLPMDDWYFLPRMKFEDAEAFYAFSMEAALLSGYWNKEYIEVLLCSEPTAEGVVDTIVKEFTPISTDYDKIDGVFRVPEAGDYYVGVHCKSDGRQMGVNIRNLIVQQSEATYDSPSEVTDLTITPVRKGALKVYVKFRMPTTTIVKGMLDPETTLKATVSSPVETKTVTGKPGEEVTVTLSSEQGDNIFTVQVSNGEHNSLITKKVVYTGVSIPATPRSLDVDFAPDMLSMSLNWEAVTTADDGEGYVNPKTLVYDIFLLDTNTGRWNPIKEGLKETTYTFEKEPGSYQEIIMLGVLARNEAGDNGNIITTLGILGTPYELPITEDFEKGNFTTDPWVTSYLYGDTGAWGLYYNKDVTDDNGAKGISLVSEGQNGDVSRLATPRFSTLDMESVTLTLELIKTNIPNVRILAEKHGEEPEIIGEISSNELKDGIQKFTFQLPANYLGNIWAGFSIETEFDDDNQILVIESISIDGNSSGVSAIGNGSLRITTDNGKIYVNGLNGREVRVAELNGTTVGVKAKSENATFNVGKGIYIVSSGSHKAKVAVK
ncbi:MAG: hypothetical protein K2K98_06885 [Muribaculaceae bacterium]|nr:hypothetical protein [Muribaculaceae bacterium]